MALLVRNLDRSRFVPELYLQRRTGPHLKSIPSDVPIHSYDDQKPFRGWNWPGRIRGNQIRHLRKIIQQDHYDLVFDRALHMTQLTGPATEGLNVARISTVVASPSDDFEFYERRFRWLKRQLLAKAYRNADRILAVSQAIANEMQSYYHVPSDHISVLYSPIDQERILEASLAPLDTLTDIPSVDLRILCVGRITEVKRQQDIYAAAKQLILEKRLRIQVDFVGDGPLKESLEEQSKQDQLSEYIRFHGFCDNPFPFYRRTDLLCLASNCEGLPNVIMEAMFLGVPVLACDCSSGPKELLGNQEFGTLVPVKNPAALAAAMLDRIERPNYWIERAKRAAIVAQERHHLPTWLNHIQEMFEDVVRKRRSK